MNNTETDTNDKQSHLIDPANLYMFFHMQRENQPYTTTAYSHVNTDYLMEEGHKCKPPTREVPL